ncbi:MAG: cytochrome c family protein [Capsulimonadales bacterium]|nr:cytochrome c family protein [Capsulimonadales bacterium]
MGLIPFSLAFVNAFGVNGKPNGPDLVLLFTNNTDGYLQSCGCTARQVGGIAKRATVLNRLKSEQAQNGVPTVLLDGGNLSKNLARTSVLLESMHRIGYDSVALSPAEDNLGVPFLRRAAELKIPLIGTPVAGSANFPETTVRPFRFLMAGRWKVGVLHLGDGPVAPEDWKRFAVTVRKQSDVSIVFSMLTVGETVRRLAALPERDRPSVALLCNSASTSDALPDLKGTTILPSPPKGEIGKIEADRVHGTNGKQWRFVLRGERVEDTVADDPVIAGIVSAYFTEEANALRSRSVTLSDDWQDLGHETAVRCGECHARALNQWALSKHSRAIRTLADKKRLIPECLTCHSEVFRRKGAFISSANTEEGVTCATCHGDGIVHTASRSKASILRNPGEADCRRCHDPANDPHFNYAIYREKIRHW